MDDTNDKKTCCLKKQNFFTLLLKVNGIILLLLSILIIGEIWLEKFDDDDFFTKIIISYGIIFVNFWVLNTMARRSFAEENGQSTKSDKT
jgi:nitrogen fixation/metabolism regulation signal transduction histidine kinase